MLVSLQLAVKEEDRLSSVIAEIDQDVRIVPRAAFIKTPTGEVISNRSFEGKGHVENDFWLVFVHMESREKD